jgi:hypothetical protein
VQLDVLTFYGRALVLRCDCCDNRRELANLSRSEQDRQCMCNFNIESRSRNHFCRRKAMSVTYSEFGSLFLPLFFGMQIASFMRRIIICCLAVPYFPTLSHKGHNSGVWGRRWGGDLLNIKCVLVFLQLLCGIFVIVRITQRGIIHVHRSSCELLVILVGFLCDVIFVDILLKNKYQILARDEQYLRIFERGILREIFGPV